jgi:hypothetical protein
MPEGRADRAIMFLVIALVAWAIFGLPIFDSFFRPHSGPAKAEASHHSTKESQAQEPWLTKDAAGFFTLGLVVVGGIQVGLFLWQLRLIRESLDDTKIAADAAKEAADVAKESLNLSRENAQTELRAYIVVATGSIFNVADPPVPPILPGQQAAGAITLRDRGPIAMLAILNAGKTPAYDVIHWGGHHCR